MTRQRTIDAKCRECTYDPLDDGTWRQQVQRCEIIDCALWKFRPKSRSKVSSAVDSAAVEPHYEGISVQVRQGMWT